MLYLFNHNGRNKRIFEVKNGPVQIAPKQPPKQPDLNLFPPNYNSAQNQTSDTGFIDNMSNSTLMWIGIAITGLVILIFIFSL